MSKNILLIEDNPGDASLVTEAIKEIDSVVEIILAADGALGVKMLQHMAENSSLPDLIISNYNLPNMTGPQVLKAVKADERFKLIPFIMLTSSDRACDRNACAGATAYLIKGSQWKDIQAIAKQIADFFPGQMESTATT